MRDSIEKKAPEVELGNVQTAHTPTSEYHTNYFSWLATFISRRIKRLLFPSSLCLLCVFIATQVIEPKDRWTSSYLDIAAAGLHGANIWFYKGLNDYFAADTQNSLVLHFWSLSLEEQFYFLFPVIYGIFTFVLKKVGRPVTELAVTIFLILVSLASMIPIFIIPVEGKIQKKKKVTHKF